MTIVDSAIDGFEEYVSGTLPYRMKKVDGSKPILVMYLHGGSSEGNDNVAQLKEEIKEFCPNLILPQGFGQK